MAIPLPELMRGLAVTLEGIRQKYWTIRNRLFLSLIWEIGGKVTFQGPIYVASFGGRVRIGRGVTVGPAVNLSASRGAVLEIGENVFLGQGTFVISRESILIGDNTLIGEYVSIRDNDHQWRDPEILIKHQGYDCAPVHIGEDVWIGRGVSVLKGVTIGNKAVVGSDAVITKDVPDGAVYVGVPASEIARRSAR